MKIGIMGRWNATCGVSLHTEMIGRTLRKMGHDITVFAPTLRSADKDWHHRHISVNDEPWVYRVFSETNEFDYPYGGRIEENEILDDQFDVFVVEGYNRFPVNEFQKISKILKRRMPLILVLHLAYIRDVEPLMRIDWDAITVFDQRYIDEILRPFGKDVANKAKIIPYPYAVIDEIEPIRPSFAGEKILFITYGRQPVHELLDYIRALREVVKRYDVVYWIIRSNGKIPVKEKWVIQTFARPSLQEIHSYVKGSDIHLLPKGESPGVVVSSTLSQILYTGTPTVVPNTRYFEDIPVNSEGIGAVIKYKPGNTIDLKKKIAELIENESLRRYVSLKAKELALKFRADYVTKEFIKLFQDL